MTSSTYSHSSKREDTQEKGMGRLRVFLGRIAGLPHYPNPRGPSSKSGYYLFIRMAGVD